MRASTGMQPKSSRLPALVSSFSAKKSFESSLTPVTMFQRLPAHYLNIIWNGTRKQILTKGAKLLALRPSQLQGGDDEAWDFAATSGMDHIQGELQTQTWGMPWSPEQFVDQAVKAGHPMMLHACLPPLLKELVQKYQTTSICVRVRHRIGRVKHWMSRAKQLENPELRLASNMYPEVAEVRKGKRMCLWKEML